MMPNCKYLILLVVLAACSRLDKEGYSKWYAAQQPQTWRNEGSELIAKEITPEIGLIRNKINSKIDERDISSLYNNPESVIRIAFEVRNTDISSEKVESERSDQIICLLDKKPAIDILIENSGPGTVLNSKFVAVFRNTGISDNSLLEVLHPNLKGVAKLKYSDLKLHDKRKLSI